MGTLGYWLPATQDILERRLDLCLPFSDSYSLQMLGKYAIIFLCLISVFLKNFKLTSGASSLSLARYFLNCILPLRPCALKLFAMSALELKSWLRSPHLKAQSLILWLQAGITYDFLILYLVYPWSGLVSCSYSLHIP